LPLYARLMRLDKPVGILLLLWPNLAALWVAAGGMPEPRLLVVFCIGTVIMRSAGCVINDYADRNFDGQVHRTRGRPLAAGLLPPREALVLFAVLVGCAAGLLFFLNLLSFYLSLVAVALAASYPFMKRYTYLPQLHLGAAFGWAVPMAFAATKGEVPTVAWLLFLATVLWALIYDTMYAMVDLADDLRAGVKSTAILFGDMDRPILAVLQAMMLGTLVLMGQRQSFGLVYYVALGVAGALFVYQLVLIKGRDPGRCFRAFLNNQWVGMALFAGVVAHYVLKALAVGGGQ
jgi:4-hydroxybenzoate polyprenyltransferase